MKTGEQSAPDGDTGLAWAKTVLFGNARVAPGTDWAAELKRAFRRKALETHPDRAHVVGRNAADLAAEFMTVQLAYRVLAAAGAPARTVQAPPHRQHGFYYSGPVPKGRLRLAEYLFYTRRISWTTLIESIVWHERSRPPIGRLAVELGFWSEAELRTLLTEREREGEQGTRLGAYATRTGRLSTYQLLTLLGLQDRGHRRIGEFFVERGLASEAEIDDLVARLRSRR